MKRSVFRSLLLAGALLISGGAFASRSTADEGMWLYNNLPLEMLEKKYGFKPTAQWADHLMKSSVRFNSGGSGSFVSSNGLVLTNHHVASDVLFKLSTADKNLLEEGFLAKTNAEELKAPDLELNQLVSIQDVTDRINSVVKEGMSPADASKARQAEMARVEKESSDKSGLRCDIVTLYGGARYHLYSYKKYTDVRLVWAPETKSAFFGGDADNFEYPRYCLDTTILRVYENDKPAVIENYLKVDADGAAEDELVFVSGHPGRTRRIYTVDALRYQRDQRLPKTLDLLRRKEVLLQQYGFGGDEQVRRARDEMFGIQNSRKAYTGMIGGLQNPSYIDSKVKYEAEMQKKIAADPKLSKYADAWKRVAEVQQKRQALSGQDVTLRSGIYGIAQELVLMAAEDSKPSEERLREYRDSNRESLLQQLYSPAPMYDDLERVQLADELARLSETRGGDDPLVLAALGGKGPRERASELIAGTKLFDVEARKGVVAAGAKGIESSSDPLIQLAKALDSEYRRLRKLTEELDEVERQAYAQITEARFALEGTSVYPDATFTLRLAFGPVKGYEVDGKKIPYTTTIGGAFEHEKTHGAKDPWILPDSWKKAKDKLNPNTPFNFVCTADIIGGNSGSPVVNGNGELVGIIFDGNIQSLTADFYYSDDVGRAVSVHIAGLLESLDKIYDAKFLAEQMGK